MNLVANAAVTYKDFQAGSTVVSGQKVAFRLFVPKGYDPTKKYPIMVTLHGAGERGVDDSMQLVHYFNRTWADSAAQAVNPTFVLAPQCPTAYQWVNTPWANGSYNYLSKPITVPMQGAVNILDSLEKKYSLDANRYYVSGISMGGYGAWYLLLMYPQRFAAGVPVCGGADTSRGPAIAKVPVWAFHAEDDGAVPVKGTREMIAAMRKAGGNPKYTEYPAAQRIGHESWVPAAQRTDLVPWVYSQARFVTTLSPLRHAKPGKNQWQAGGLPFGFLSGDEWSDALGRLLNTGGNTPSIR